MCDTDGIDDVREEIAVLLDELEGKFCTDTIRALVSSLDETSLSLREADTAKPERSETPAPAGFHPVFTCTVNELESRSSNYTISRRRIRLIEITQKMTVATSIHAILRTIRLVIAGRVAIRISDTRWVRERSQGRCTGILQGG